MLRAVLGLCLACSAGLQAAEPVTLRLVGDWQVEVTAPSAGLAVMPLTATLLVAPPLLVTVSAEKYDALPVFNATAAGWAKGAPLRGVFAQECSTPGLLDPDTLQFRTGPEPDSARLEAGKDYGADLAWGTVGRLPDGRLKENQPAFASYRHGMLRIDSIVLAGDGRLTLRQGGPRAAAPLPPKLDQGDRLLANLWLPGRITRLGPEHLFPILETVCPEPPKPALTVAEKLLPNTMKKLRDGQPLRMLAWGDSVTVGTYLPDWQHTRWQEQFTARLRARFPAAKIELLTEAWGGRNTSSYLGEPPGSPHNYREKVLALKPDLIVSEFVNDAGFSPEQVEQRYSRLLADFQAIGAEWIILTPHYVRPDWMGLTRERDCDDDPRPYVKGLREFSGKHRVALADAARRYGRLWRQGIPYSTLMLNSINHPDARGMKMFADALLELFPEPR